MKLLSFVNEDLQCKTLEAQDETFLKLDDCTDKIKLMYGISNEDQRFFYEGKQAKGIDLFAYKQDDPISVINLKKFQPKTIYFKIKVKDKENNEDLVKFFAIDLVRFEGITVMDGLIHVIKNYDLKKMFYHDFYFGLFEFEDLIEKPLSYYEDSETIPIYFKKNTIPLLIKYNNDDFTYQAGLKTEVKHLVKKIQIVLGLHDENLNMYFENIKIPELRITKSLPLNNNTINLITESRNTVQFRGLSLKYKCQNPNCKESALSKTKELGLGIFDLKLLSNDINCNLCLRQGAFEGFYLKNTRIKIIGYQNSTQIDQTDEYFKETDTLFNYDISPHIYLILLCI